MKRAVAEPHGTLPASLTIYQRPTGVGETIEDMTENRFAKMQERSTWWNLGTMEARSAQPRGGGWGLG